MKQVARMLIQIIWLVNLVFENEEEIISEGSIVWVNTNKTIWEGRVNKTPFCDFPEDAKHFKLIQINTKKEYRVLIRSFSKEYKHTIIPVSTHRYKDRGVMEKSVLDIKVGGPLRALFLEFFFTSVFRDFKPCRVLILNLRSLEKNVNTDRQIRYKQKVVLNLFAICIDELVFPPWC